MEKNSNPDQKNLTLTLDTAQLSKAQIRHLLSLHSILVQTLTTTEEKEFFEGSAEMMRVLLQVLHQGKFPLNNTKKEKIPYATQALEYAFDQIFENSPGQKLLIFDH